jgi:hypothetical protein
LEFFLGRVVQRLAEILLFNTRKGTLKTMDSIPIEKKAAIYIKCIDHIATELRGHAGLDPGAIPRTIWKLRTELERTHHLGGVLPDVANLDHAAHGPKNDFSTLIDVTEITFDTILAYDGISRGRRYKSNEFATAMERSFNQRNHDLALNYSALKATLDIRSRQLGCILAAAGTMLLTPLELRTLLLSLLTDDLLANQEHLLASVQERPKMIREVLLSLGLTSSTLAQHFVASLPHTPTSNTELRCKKFQGLMHILSMDSQECKHSWTRIKQHCFDCQPSKPTKQYRDDGHGGWEEQVNADSANNGWSAWVPHTPRRSNKQV